MTFGFAASAVAADVNVKKAPVAPGADRCAKIEPPPGTPAMPVGYFFGLTDPTDPGDPCSSEFVFENIAHAGKRDGRYFSTTSATEISYTFARNAAVAFAAYGTYTRWSDVTVTRTVLAEVGDGVAVNRLNLARFDGLSAELFARFLARSPGQPVAMTVSIKPRWSLVDNVTGYPAQGYGSEFKLLADAVLAERLFAAANVTYGLGVQKFDIANSPWLHASVINASAALTRQAYFAERQTVESVFVGVEGRYRSVYAGLALDRLVGQAVFLGPTLAIGFPGERILSLAWSPQVAGRSRLGLSAGALDLDSFERMDFRLKFATPVAP